MADERDQHDSVGAWAKRYHLACRALIEATLREHDLGPTQWYVLHRLVDVGPTLQRDLSRMLRVERATLSGVVATLVRRPDGSITVTPTFLFRVLDTVDLCPGDSGSSLGLINEQLATYNSITDLFDAFVHIDAEDTEYVYDWRQQQEAALRNERGAGMTEEQVVKLKKRPNSGEIGPTSKSKKTAKPQKKRGQDFDATDNAAVQPAPGKMPDVPLRSRSSRYDLYSGS